MKSITLTKIPNTPKVIFNYYVGKIDFIGPCFPEDSASFFEPIISQIRQFYEDLRGTCSVHFEFSYLNGCSITYLYEILNLISSHKQTSGVFWHFSEYGDEMWAKGKELEYLTDLKLIFIKTVRHSKPEYKFPA